MQPNWSIAEVRQMCREIGERYAARVQLHLVPRSAGRSVREAFDAALDTGDLDAAHYWLVRLALRADQATYQTYAARFYAEREAINV